MPSRRSPDAATSRPSPPRWPTVAVDGVIPRWLVRPGTVEQVAQILVLASAEGLAVTPGAAARASRSAIPPAGSTSCWTGPAQPTVLEYVPDDMVASVQCGITLDAIAARLGQHGQRLPLDPAPGGGRSVGGVLATAAAGRSASATAPGATSSSVSASSRQTVW